MPDAAYFAAQQAADECVSALLERQPELGGPEDSESTYDDPSGLFFFTYFMEDGTRVEVNVDGTIAHYSISNEG